MFVVKLLLIPIVFPVMILGVLFGPPNARPTWVDEVEDWWLHL